MFTDVIDECHSDGMNNPGSVAGRALLSLTADHWLLLSGTPAQNTLEEMQMYYALFRHKSLRKDFREAEKERRMLNRAMNSSAAMKINEVVDPLSDIGVAVSA